MVKLTAIQKGSLHILTGDPAFECLIFDLWLLLHMQSGGEERGGRGVWAEVWVEMECEQGEGHIGRP